MPLIALVLLVLWIALVPGLRLVYQSRTTGDSGLRMTTGNAGRLQMWLAVLSTAALCAPGLAALAALAGLRPLPFLDRTGPEAAGVILALLGIGGAGVAQTSMGTSWRFGIDPRERTSLVVRGPFRLVRNPIYSMMFLTILGIALTVPNLVAATGLALLLLSMQLEVRLVEEPYLRRVHGEAYLRYACSTGRFLPGIGRAPHPLEPSDPT